MKKSKFRASTPLAVIPFYLLPDGLIRAMPMILCGLGLLLLIYLTIVIRRRMKRRNLQQRLELIRQAWMELEKMRDEEAVHHPQPSADERAPALAEPMDEAGPPH